MSGNTIRPDGPTHAQAARAPDVPQPLADKAVFPEWHHLDA
ncbi:hypothetical protein [Nocardia arthritidis]|nr:hypothetical protein [Nocardia arthritidis]